MANFTPVNGSSGNQSVRPVTATHNSYETVEMVFIATVTGSLSLVTVVGNILVMLSIKVNRQLQTVNNYFLFSLACADLIIGAFSMNLYTVYIIKGYWPLGAVVCDLWLALDYVVSNASVMNLLIISFDRYFCVTKPLTYPARRTTKTAGLMIAAAWVLSFVLWAPAILFWQFVVGERTVPDNMCFIQFLSNPAVTFGTAIAAFYLPVVIMTVLYIHISLASRSRVHKHRPEGPKEKKAKPLAFLKSPLMKQSAKKAPPGAAREELRNGKLEEAPPPVLPPPPRPLADKDTSNESSSGSATHNAKERPPTELSTTEVTTPATPAPRLQPRALNPASKWSKIQIVTKQTGNECVTAIEIVPATPAGMRPATNVARKFASIARNQVRKKRQMAARERKVTRTIFAILLAFILTWTPYNVMVLVNTFCNRCVPRRRGPSATGSAMSIAPSTPPATPSAMPPLKRPSGTCCYASIGTSALPEPSGWAVAGPKDLCLGVSARLVGSCPSCGVAPDKDGKAQRTRWGCPFTGQWEALEISKLVFFYELRGAPSPQKATFPSTLSPSQQMTTAKSPGRGFYIFKKKSFYWEKMRFICFLAMASLWVRTTGEWESDSFGGGSRCQNPLSLPALGTWG
ncbi:hypothetical protein QTO34_003512, partial [Cnephaeus nilssonii]